MCGSQVCLYLCIVWQYFMAISIRRNEIAFIYFWMRLWFCLCFFCAAERHWTLVIYHHFESFVYLNTRQIGFHTHSSFINWIQRNIQIHLQTRYLNFLITFFSCVPIVLPAALGHVVLLLFFTHIIRRPFLMDLAIFS